jgi:hypothetical protein
MVTPYVAQAGFKLLSSSDPPESASWVTGTTRLPGPFLILPS